MRVFYFLLILLFSLWNTSFAQPDKIWASCYGSETNVSGVVYDSSGYIYVVGSVSDSTISLATPNSFKSDLTAPNYLAEGYLAKFDTAGNRIWGTYISNGHSAFQPKIALDKDGNVLVAGLTKGSQNLIATPGTYISSLPLYYENSGSYGYVLKFDADGNRIFGTYILDNLTTPIGPNISLASFAPASITSDADGNIIIAGNLLANNSNEFEFQSPNTYKPSLSLTAAVSGFILKLNGMGNFEWGTFIGSDSYNYLNHVTTNSLNEIFVAGVTQSSDDIATPDAAYENYNPGNMPFDGFINKFNKDGQRIWGTYMNGMNPAGGIVLNMEEDLIVLGNTNNSTGIATSAVHQEEYKGDVDVVLSKWDTNGQKLWATYYGGSEMDKVNDSDLFGFYFTNNAIALDANDNILIGGQTKSNSGIRVGCTYNSPLEEPRGFLAKFYPDGNIMWGSYFDVMVESIATSNIGESFFIGARTHTANGLTTPGAFQENQMGSESAYIIKMQGDFICPELDISIAYENDSLILAENFEKYEWYKNDTLLTENNNWLIPDEIGGYYHAILEDSCNCVYYTDTIWVDPISIEEKDVQNINVKLYPNPNNGSFYIKGSIKNPPTQNISFSIRDIVGKTLYEGEIPVDDNNFYHEIDIKDLNPGVYLLHIKNEDEEHYLKWVKE